MKFSVVSIGNRQASERLCKRSRSITLFDADNCLKWMFLDINRYPNEFSNKISEALYTKIKARRNHREVI